MLPCCPTAVMVRASIRTASRMPSLPLPYPDPQNVKAGLAPSLCGPLLGLWYPATCGKLSGSPVDWILRIRKGTEALDNRLCTHSHKHLQVISELSILLPSGSSNSSTGDIPCSAHQDSRLQQSWQGSQDPAHAQGWARRGD